MTITILLLIACVGVSLMAFNDSGLMAKLLFSPYEIRRKNQWYRFITHGFVHADYVHLFMNMWVLYIFGTDVEKTLSMIYGSQGTLYFILLYAGGLLFSTLYSFWRHIDHPHYAAVGASGAISSVTFAFIMIYPTAGLYLFPFPFEIPAFVFGGLYLIYSWYMARRGRDNIGHDAHFFGALYGVVFMIILEPRLIPLLLEYFA
jgi:membrane associated rhomboid family serine protease